MVKTAPEKLLEGHVGFCPGCGHGIVARLLFESLEELGLSEQALTVVDVACCSLLMFGSEYDYIGAAHGRTIATACGLKRVRKQNPVIAYLGDGAAYSIGIAHTYWAAARNENIVTIIVNNGVFGMTGGQMAPTTLEGQKTTSSAYGRNIQTTGSPLKVENLLSGLEIAFLARGSVNTPSNIRKTKNYVKKAIQKQMNNEGFSLVEILSPCPTNWNMSPLDSLERINSTVSKYYDIGVFYEKED